jgi:hypothetical protein
MKNTFMSMAVVAAALLAPGIARADEVSDRTAAIQLCRTEIAAQAGVPASEVDFDQVQVRSRLVRVDFDLWRNGRLENIRCDVRRGGELQIAQIQPDLRALATR